MPDEKRRIIEPRPVSGFPEWLPAEERKFQRLVNIIRTGFETFGFAPIETPAAQLLEILQSKGEINKQIYGLYRPNVPASERETELALHFDLTVPLARYVAMNFDKLTFPFRRYQIQKVWRGERPQKGRFREFYQCDIDVVGNETLDALADAEIPAVIYEVFTRMNIGDFVIRISNRKILQGFLESEGISGDAVMDALRAIDRLPKTGREAVENELRGEVHLSPETTDAVLSLVGISGSGSDVLREIAGRAVNHPTFAAGLSELRLLIENMNALGVPEAAFEIDLSITRGLDYYTGTVYEVFLRAHPELGSVCSGGRYDDLASHFTRRKLPGVGISIGLTRLFSHLLSVGVVRPESKTPTRVLVTVLDRKRLSEYFTIATSLRRAQIPTEVFLEDKRLKAQIKYADKKGIPLIVIAGETEFAEGTLQVKALKTGEQKTVRSENLIDEIHRLS